MTLFNSDWITFGGEPITGRAPTAVVTHPANQELNPEQRGAVAHAFKLFCDAVNVSANPQGYHVQHRTFVDGTYAILSSNNGAKKVEVWVAPLTPKDFLSQVFIVQIYGGGGRGYIKPFGVEGGTLEPNSTDNAPITAQNPTGIAGLREYTSYIYHPSSGKPENPRSGGTWKNYPAIDARFKLNGKRPRYGNIDIRWGDAHYSTQWGSGRYCPYGIHPPLQDQISARFVQGYLDGRIVFAFPPPIDGAEHACSGFGFAKAPDNQRWVFAVVTTAVREQVLLSSVIPGVGAISPPTFEQTFAYRLSTFVKGSKDGVTWTTLLEVRDWGLQRASSNFGDGGDHPASFMSAFHFNNSGTEAVRVVQRRTYGTNWPSAGYWTKVTTTPGGPVTGYYENASVHSRLEVLKITWSVNTPVATLAFDDRYQQNVTPFLSYIDAARYAGTQIIAADYLHGTDEMQVLHLQMHDLGSGSTQSSTGAATLTSISVQGTWELWLNNAKLDEGSISGAASQTIDNGPLVPVTTVHYNSASYRTTPYLLHLDLRYKSIIYNTEETVGAGRMGDYFPNAEKWDVPYSLGNNSLDTYKEVTTIFSSLGDPNPRKVEKTLGRDDTYAPISVGFVQLPTGDAHNGRYGMFVKRAAGHPEVFYQVDSQGVIKDATLIPDAKYPNIIPPYARSPGFCVIGRNRPQS